MIRLSWMQAGAQDAAVRLTTSFYRHRDLWWCRIVATATGVQRCGRLYWPADDGGEFGHVEDARPPVVRRSTVELVSATHARARDTQFHMTATDNLERLAKAPHNQTGRFKRTGTRPDAATHQ